MRTSSWPTTCRGAGRKLVRGMVRQIEGRKAYRKQARPSRRRTEPDLRRVNLNADSAPRRTKPALRDTPKSTTP